MQQQIQQQMHEVEKSERQRDIWLLATSRIYHVCTHIYLCVLPIWRQIRTAPATMLIRIG